MAHPGFPNGIGINENVVIELIRNDNDSHRTPEEKVAKISLISVIQDDKTRGMEQLFEVIGKKYLCAF